VKREIPSKIVYEDEQCLAFEDINPQAPIHILVVPKRHLDGLAQATVTDTDQIGHLLLTVNRLAKEKGVIDSGYRVVINTGKGAGQTVFHLHFHLLAGRSMHWPPG
jgi:histidine triad (HIT) family protein